MRPLTREQFIYQPALEQTLRAGVDRYPNVEVLHGHERTGLHQDAVGADLTIRHTGPDSEEVRQAPRRYVIAADGGSSPTRTRLNFGFEGRTFKTWPEVDRQRFHCNPARPAVDCPTPLGHHRWEFPVLAGEHADAPVNTAGGAGAAGRSGHRTRTRPGTTCSHLQPPRPLRRRWRIGCSWPATPRMRPSGSLGSAGATIARLRIAVGPLGSASTNRSGAGSGTTCLPRS